jgi:4-aminobutyrate aminotransferase
MRTCQGIFVEDWQGRRDMDFHGNNVHQVGFSNPDVIAAIKKQLDELPFCTRRYTNRIAVDLAKKLAQIAPDNLNKSLFCPGGAEAVGMALKLARVATGRYKTISMWDSLAGHGTAAGGYRTRPAAGRISLRVRLFKPGRL